ncbi:MAG: hypothetical protein GY792_05540 [Gammaproteobacteria bacterium]|nr:hypothetical protein [Gammaproteobacteria bacterium]
MLNSRAANSNSPIRALPLLCSTIISAILLLAGCQANSVKTSSVSSERSNGDNFLVVDCLLPGQVRRLGSRITYLSPRRPVKTTASDCEIRGGEYVSYDRADYRTSLLVWLPQAKEGDANAQNYVGEIYEKGLGVDPDYDTAIAWYKKAAAQNNTRAQINLGFLHEKGLGAKKDISKALNWYRKASGLEQEELQFASTIQVSSVDESELRLLRQEAERQKRESKKLRSELNANRSSLKNQKRDISKRERELESLRAELNRRSQLPKTDITADDSRKLNELQAQLQRKEAEVKKQRDQISGLESTLSSEQSRMSEELLLVQQEAARQKSESARLRQELNSTSEKLKAQSNDLDQAENKLSSLRKQFGKENSASQALSHRQLSELNASLDQQEQKVQQQRQQIAALENTVIEQQAKMADVLVSSVREQRRLEADLKQQTGEASKLKQQLDRTQQELTRTNQSIEQEQPAHEEKRRQLQQAREALLASHRSTGELEQKITTLERDLAQRESELGLRGEAVTKLREKTNQYRQLLVSLEEERLSERSSLQADANKQEQEISQLKQKLNAAQQDYEESRAQLNRINPDLDLKQATLEQTQKALVRAKTSGVRKAAEVDRLKAQQQSYIDKLLDQQKRIARYQSEVVRYKTQLTKIKADQQIAQLDQTTTQQQADDNQSLKLPAPSIEILDPPIALTRGIPSVRLRSASRERLVTGKVTAPAGLVSFTINDNAQKLDEIGIFSTNVKVEDEQTPVKLVAVDRLGQRATLDFLLIPKLRHATTTTAANGEGGDASQRSSRFASTVDFGRYHALVIGNNQYKHFPDLSSARNDAERTAALLRTRYGFQTTTLIDASRYDMLSALNKLRETLTEKDNLLIYYAGHGELDRVNLRGHWLPVDAEPNSSANWISNIAITDILNAMSAKHILVVADSCYSGSLTRSSMARLDAGMTNEKRVKWLKVMARTRSRTVLTSGGLQPVLDQGGGKHSVFAKSFLKALEENDSILEAYKLYRDLAKEVQKTAAKFGIDQIPEYAPIRHGGHEAGEFFFIPQG